MAEKKRQDELMERQRKIRQLKATGNSGKSIFWNGILPLQKIIKISRWQNAMWSSGKRSRLKTLAFCYGLPLNRAIYTEDGDMWDIYAGDFLVVGLTEDDFGSLTSEQMQKFEEQFHQPQMFVRMGRSNRTGPSL